MKKIKFTLFTFIFLVSACRHTTDLQKIIYYKLPFPLPKTPVSTQYSKTAKILWIKPVELSDYLTTSGLVYQTNDVRYVTAQHHLWASPLDQQLQKALLINLTHALPDWFVSPESINADQWTLSMKVDDFHGRYDGSVVISGIGLIQHHDQGIKYPFYFELKQSDNGYEALVRTLAKGWEEVMQAAEKMIKTQSLNLRNEQKVKGKG